ncbi:MAG: phytanoyl-CoA dioxygenase family protein [Pseudomonadota bacterium]
MGHRHTLEHVEAWRRDGGVLIPNLIPPEDIAPVVKDFEALYGEREPKDAKAKAGTGGFNMDQFKNIDDMPFPCSPALNMLGLHPAVIALARETLGTDDVRLYQSHSWAKFTGGADYEQPHHCDYKNHTLTVPSDEEKLRTINIMIYATDVGLDDGAIAYVPQGDSNPITGEDRLWNISEDGETQAQLRALEKRAPGPAGSAFAYGIDVYHRGMNLTRPGGRRFTLTASYKAAGNDMIGWSAWPFWFMKPWHLIFDNATPDQLSCLGVPKPGDPFWTARTLKRTRERWPNWNVAPYEEAMAA